jgi:hypothetical protein
MHGPRQRNRPGANSIWEHGSVEIPKNGQAISPRCHVRGTSDRLLKPHIRKANDLYSRLRQASHSGIPDA